MFRLFSTRSDCSALGAERLSRPVPLAVQRPLSGNPNGFFGSDAVVA